MSRDSAPIWYATALLAAILVSAPGARAAGTPPPPRPEKATPDSFPAAGPDSSMLGTVAPDHDAAGKRYAEGYGLARDATKDLADGQPERARKKFGKARKLFERATQLDARYYQAWNMLGYSARQCGDLQAALAAYGKCLEIAPEYADAHEYLGETYLKTGEIEKAKAELAWLRARKSAQADILAGKIAQAESGGGDAGKSADDWKGGASDSTGAREK